MGKISNSNESITEDFRNVINLDNLRRFKDKLVTFIQGLLVTKQDTITDLDTIRNKSNEGHTAYDWGNHTLQGYITKSVNDLINYYTKNDIYTKSEVQTLIDAVKQFTYEVVATLPTPSVSTMGKIYLVPADEGKEKNIKDEYITILDNSIYKWEQIGSTAIDLSNYPTFAQMTSAINTALSGYVTSSDLTTAISAEVSRADAKYALKNQPDHNVVYFNESINFYNWDDYTDEKKIDILERINPEQITYVRFYKSDNESPKWSRLYHTVNQHLGDGTIINEGFYVKEENFLIFFLLNNDLEMQSMFLTTKNYVDDALSQKADKTQIIHMRVIERDSKLVIVSNIPLNNFADNSIALARKGFWSSGTKDGRITKHGWRFVGAHSNGHRYIGTNDIDSKDLRNVDIRIIDSYKPTNYNFYINTFTIGGITPTASNITSLITRDEDTYASIYNGKKQLEIYFGVDVGNSDVKFTVYRVHLGIGIPQFNCIAPFNVVLSSYDCYDYTSFLEKVAFELKSGI